MQNLVPRKPNQHERLPSAHMPHAAQLVGPHLVSTSTYRCVHLLEAIRLCICAGSVGRSVLPNKRKGSTYDLPLCVL